MNRSNYDRDKAYNQDNVVDIMNRAGIHSIWREHDGGDKAVAHRIKEMILVAKDSDPLCNKDVCYDTAMLEDFEKDTQDLTQDSIIFYHISGSHGPTYFHRRRGIEPVGRSRMNKQTKPETQRSLIEEFLCHPCGVEGCSFISSVDVASSSLTAKSAKKIEMHSGTRSMALPILKEMQ